jgi:hypothetical protein
VFQSCEAWTQFLKNTFLREVEGGPRCEAIVSVHNAGMSGLERRESWCTPLFDVELVVSGTKVGFSPSVEEIHRYAARAPQHAK